MGYEFIFGIPVAVIVSLVIVFGLFIALERIEDWVPKLMEKYRGIALTVGRSRVSSGRNPLWWSWRNK